ncbi:MAG: alpha-amylase/alpha-mannosidase [Thermoplasmatales archaeon]|jgi:alpha-amylase|nr:alpha-amylase/alpha-mannosidase [Thermoplasmatales archaeon]MCU0850302.1 glycoside hydrolase family 57 protein [Candidatus Thermoplasmatota archaeon]
MPSICFYFEVHQPFRLNHFSVFNIGNTKDIHSTYFNKNLNQKIFEKVANKCYLPTNNLLLDLIRKYDGRFRISYSLTGTFVEYCENYKPELLDSFKELFKTGAVDLIDETYFHSLSGLYDELDEFEEQIKMHRQMIRRIFNYKPKVFRNTEAIFDNRIARKIADLGYKGILTEGAEKILGWRSPNFIYKAVNANLKVLLRNYKLSDDVGFRFSARNWPGFPLTADKYANWMSNSYGDVINLFMDYETFGEHQWVETGIFEFLKHLPGEVLKHDSLDFATVSEAVERYNTVGEVDSPWAISWADEDRNVSTWLGNNMQIACFNELKDIGRKLKRRGDRDLLYIWRLLQTSDHLYYISTKGFEDGNVHAYFSPYDIPYDGFINYMNILQDLKEKAENR